MGIFKKLFNEKKKTDEELKVDVLKKATEHLNEHSEQGKSFQANSVDSAGDSVIEKNYIPPQNIDQNKKQNIRAVMSEVAERGETGVLPVSISDKKNINHQDTITALDYLVSQNYAEAINSPSGMKYYLTEAGRKYYNSKEFTTNF
jgi:hypothetical protein